MSTTKVKLVMKHTRSTRAAFVLFLFRIMQHRWIPEGQPHFVILASAMGISLPTDSLK